MSIDERRTLLPSATYRELSAAGVWLKPALVATATARARVRAWDAAGRPGPPHPVRVAGDVRVSRIVREVADRLPPPARWWVSAHVQVVSLPQRAAGIATTPPAALPHACDPPRLVVVSGDDDDAEVAGTVAHEFGHCWLDDTVLATLDPIERHGAAMALCSAITPAEVDALARTRALEEARAARFGAALGLASAATDPERCARIGEATMRRAFHPDEVSR